jgi:hypothetical protein
VAAQDIEYFVSSFGFTRIAESSSDGAHSTLLRQGSAQLGGKNIKALYEAVERDGMAGG